MTLRKQLIHYCLALVLLAACGGVAPSQSRQKTQQQLADGPAPLQWFYTCGDPVCRLGADSSNGSIRPCDTERVGDPCNRAGDMCDPGVGCGVKLLCTDQDPTSHGCPVSKREYKRGISYLDSERLAGVARDVQGIRLASYEYSAPLEDGKKHLGFIIDDNPSSPAVDATGQRVDLYGYTSMLVAAVQVQAKEIESLKRQVAALTPNAVPVCEAGR